MCKNIALILFILGGCVVSAQEYPLYQSDAFSVFPRKVVQGEYHANVVAPNALTSTFDNKQWLQHKGGVGYPSFSCAVPISNTMYNLSVEEMASLVEADSTWRTGTLWGGVWTRDVSYSALLALAYMDPDVTRNSLMKKVRNGKIVQDTGTGGSWPVSTDRMTWTLAAWQVYLATGDKKWVEKCFDIVYQSMLQDEQVVYDSETGLVRGEASFLDWREEVYPRWMQPADIAQSECLGTNAVFFRANQIAARMAQICGEKDLAVHFNEKAESIKAGINKYLWLEDKGYYGQYLYGRGSLTVSPRSETLGEALCVIFGIADSARARRIVSSVALSPYGTPAFSPQIPNVYPYHNNAVWPFVQAYWMWASAEAGNLLSLEHSIASIYRATAMYASNMENFNATTGDLNTATNSPSQLWSVAGNISVAHRILMGITLQEDGIAFHPMVPKAWEGAKKLTNFKYRKAVLDIIVTGYGNKVVSCYIDGKRQKNNMIPANISGRHTVKVTLNSEYVGAFDPVNHQPIVTAPETPQAFLDDANLLGWHQVPNVKSYIILRNGEAIDTVPERRINDNRYTIPVATTYTEYQVIAVDEDGVQSFASEPVVYYNYDNERLFDMIKFAPATTFAECKGFTGEGAVEVAPKMNSRIVMSIDVPEDGIYQIDFRYANGSDNRIYSNKCAVRTLWYNNNRVGRIVFPQRGKGLWQVWGNSTSVRLKLKSGAQTLVLAYEPENQNMNEEGVNRAMIDYMRIVRVK